jgi:lipopolysaccharide transport system ATP-binding protein
VGFQRKCIGKMSAVAHEGRTVVFVSHNMAVIQSLCERGIVLEGGAVAVDAPIDEAVSAYLRAVEADAVLDLGERQDRSGWNEVWLTGVEVRGADGAGTLATGKPAYFMFTVERASGFERARVSCRFTVVNLLGHPVATFSSDDLGPDGNEAAATEGAFGCEVPQLPLVPGRYRIDVEVHGRAYLQDAIEGAAFFDVEQGVMGGRPVSGDTRGDVVVEHRWTTPSLD